VTGISRSSKEFAILGLLAISPKSGYDIKKEVETVLSHFWNESYGSIYPILRRLDKDGLAEREAVDSAKGPQRYVYTITADGLAEFEDWLQQPVQPTPPRSEFLLKLFFGRFTSTASVLKLIRDYGEGTRRMHSMLTRIHATVSQEESSDPGFPFWELTMQCGLKSMESLMGWCEATVQHLESRNGEESQ